MIAKDYPKVRLVYGDLDSAALLEEESAKADIVANFASADHEAGAKSIIKGIQASSTPTYLVHTSGTGLLLYPDIEAKTFGEARTKVWDDVKDIDAILNDIPDTAPHRMIDRAVLDPKLPTTAIVCPPTIYGPGRGANTRSIQVPSLARSMLVAKRGFFVGEGKAYWHQVHVRDLSLLYLLLIEDAATAVAGGQPKATWGPKGYYFAENGEFVWGDICRAIAKEAHKQNYLESAECVSLPSPEVEKLCKAGSWLWGANSRGVASRARQELGWQPKEKPLLDFISSAVEHEQDLIKAGKEPAFRV